MNVEWLCLYVTAQNRSYLARQSLLRNRYISSVCNWNSWCLSHVLYLIIDNPCEEVNPRYPILYFCNILLRNTYLYQGQIFVKSLDINDACFCLKLFSEEVNYSIQYNIILLANLYVLDTLIE